MKNVMMYCSDVREWIAAHCLIYFKALQELPTLPNSAEIFPENKPVFPYSDKI